MSWTAPHTDATASHQYKEAPVPVSMEDATPIMKSTKRNCNNGINQRQVRNDSTKGRRVPRDTKGSSIMAGMNDAHELPRPLRLSIIIATNITDAIISPLPKLRAGAHNHAHFGLSSFFADACAAVMTYCFLPNLGSILMNADTRNVTAQRTITMMKNVR